MSIFENNIISIYRESGKEWLKDLPEQVRQLELLWGLSHLAPLENLTYNYVLSGLQGDIPIILKLSPNASDLGREANALGAFMGFVGQQYPIKAGKKDLYIDLLFYHLKLRCYVVIELKGGEFDSRDAGQMSAYLSAVDDQIRHENDQPSIGIILCKTKDNIFAEYVLRNFNRPIGVAEFEVKIVEKLPNELKSSLPTVKEIEAELSVTPKEKKTKIKNKKH